MRLCLCAMGRMRPGPEQALFDDYRRRFDKLGKGLGLGPLQLYEGDERKAQSPEAQVALLTRAAPEGARRIVLDERGRQMTSPEFAALLARWRDAGQGATALFIGGADGFAPAFAQSADLSLSLGPMVWPHLLVRVLITEQLYRAASLLAGLPYHRA